MDDLSSIRGTHMIGGENQLPQSVLLVSLHVSRHTCTYTRAHKHTDTPTRFEILKYRISFDQSAMKRNETFYTWVNLENITKQTNKQKNNNRHGGRNRKQRAQILNHQFKAKRVNWKQARPQTLRARPWWHTSFSKATPPKPPQAMLPAGDQGFQCLRLWRTFIQSNHHSFIWFFLPLDDNR